jgi:formylglycine-generating enzyme required for sulfatase activity
MIMNDNSEHSFSDFIDSNMRYMREVNFPMQKFVYPPIQPLTPNLSKCNFQYQLFEFEVAIVEGSEIKKVRKQGICFVENLDETVTLEMVQIPSGRFLMGTPQEEMDYGECESQQHLVNVPSFCIGKFEVTQSQWQVVMHHNLSMSKGFNLPVENVSWQDAIEFCHRLSSLTGRCYRLPSEAEWEYACRAGSTTPFYFGDKLTTQLANYWDTNEERQQDEDPPQRGSVGIAGLGSVGYLQTQPVGSYPPNAFGLYDMHGNVFELCQDGWHDNYLGAPTDGSAWGSGEETGMVVIRGGSFDYYEDRCRSDDRSETRVNYRYHGTGFRVACSVN